MQIEMYYNRYTQTLRLDFTTEQNVLKGWFMLILMDPDGSNQVRLFPDNRHSPTMECFEW